MLVIPFPQIDPVLVSFGPIAIRWYALAYVAGLLLGWWYLVRLLKIDRLWAPAPFNGQRPVTAEQVGDLFIWATLGVILGGRIGYVLFYGLIYQTDYFLLEPWHILYAWKGGMSFHGGAIGVVLAIILFARRSRIDMVQLGDLVAAVTPIGLFFGRVANFVNGELWGKPTSVWWAMRFPIKDDAGHILRFTEPSHPSQLYEAGLEGLLLFAILNVMIFRYGALRKPGLVIAAFFAGYGLFRIVVEMFFRDSDQTLLGGAVTMGEVLSLPMWIVAGFFLWYALFRERAASNA